MESTNEQTVNGYKIVEKDGLFGLLNSNGMLVLDYKYTKMQFKREELNIYETFEEEVVLRKDEKGKDIKHKRKSSKLVGRRTINVVKCEIIEPKRTEKAVYVIENLEKPSLSSNYVKTEP